MIKAEIKDYFNPNSYFIETLWEDFSKVRIENIKYFFIFRNLFEKNLFNEEFKFEYEIDKYKDDLLFNIKSYIINNNRINELKNIVEYFKSKLNDKYFQIKTRGTKEEKIYKEWKDFLLKNEINNENIEFYLLYLLFFIYRLRNNLFHGIKIVEELENQEELFSYTNKIISIFLDYNRTKIHQ